MPLRFSTTMLALVLALAYTVGASDFVNEYDERFTFRCPEGQVINGVYSEYSSYYEDRRYKISCGPAPAGAKLTATCNWPKFTANWWQQDSSYICPVNQVIAGVDGFHSRTDRIYKFRCCSAPGYITYDCKYTRYVNSYEGTMNYRVTPGKVIIGWANDYSYTHDDRIHKMLECSFGTRAV